ncbi:MULTISPECIES: hypothetical protein [unclassified Neisseria]|nr:MULTISPECIES: hypothetical protein [unclassified Neisseria]MBF0804246.1 hypothetical protein [Neisseria sp. 19428wB4_WF04]TFU42980.1 hypothetical protein E4T99_07775 [Neisseria sp. WF04]
MIFNLRLSDGLMRPSEKSFKVDVKIRGIMKYLLFLSALALSACAATHQEEYLVSAYDSKGHLLNKRVQLGSNKAGVPLAQDTLCKIHPRAVIRVHTKWNKRLAEDFKPYSCGLKKEL